jgi:type I restriction enzyme S subunit
VDRARGITYGIVLPGPDVPGGVPVVKAGNVTGNVMSAAEKLKRTTPEIERPYRRSRVRPGDLVMAIRGSIGAVALVPERFPAVANLTQDTARIAPLESKIDSEWLHLALRSRGVQGQIARVSTGATVRGLNIWSLKRLQIPDIPRHVQVSAAAEARRRLEVIQELRGEVLAQQRLLDEHRQALITATVTGKADLTGEAT